jgi:hypothetical protein
MRTLRRGGTAADLGYSAWVPASAGTTNQAGIASGSSGLPKIWR